MSEKPGKWPITLSLKRRTHELLDALTDRERGWLRSKSEVVDQAVAEYAAARQQEGRG